MCGTTQDFAWLLCTFTEIIDPLIVLVIMVTMVVVLWNVFKVLILNGGEDGKIKEAKSTILIGFIVLVVMSSVWGIVALLRTALI